MENLERERARSFAEIFDQPEVDDQEREEEQCVQHGLTETPGPWEAPPEEWEGRARDEDARPLPKDTI